MTSDGSVDAFIAHVAMAYYCFGGYPSDEVLLETLLDARDGFFAL